MKLFEYGEGAVVRNLQALLDDTGILSTEEDAIAFPIEGSDAVVVVNVDTIAWESDIVPGMTNYQAGKKIVAVTYSDLAAKGVKPSFFMSSINFPGYFEEKELFQTVQGIQNEVHRVDSLYLGGDLGTAKEAVIAGTAVGFTNKGSIMPRTGASPSDIICTTGDFGITGLGFAALYDHLELPSPVKEISRKAIMEPQASIEQGIALAKSGAVTSCMDSSDGLAITLCTLARQSGVSMTVENLPIAKKVLEYCSDGVVTYDPVDLALVGGEEFHLVFTVEKERFSEVKNLFRRNSWNFREIGACTKGKGVHLRRDDKLERVDSQGWDSFSSIGKNLEEVD